MIKASIVACGIAFSTLAPLPAIAQQKSDETVPAVVVAPVAQQAAGAINTYVGRVGAVSTVNLEARVTGFLEKQNFTEGAFVKKGDVLFEIEKQTYQADVDKASATVDGAQATVADNQKALDRATYLRDKDDVTQAQVDAANATLLSSQASLAEAKADLETAKINLGYTNVVSPIDGRIGIANANVGNVVGATTGTLATIVSMDPIYVTFFIGERVLLDERRKGLIETNSSKLDVKITLSDGDVYPTSGKINYVGTQVDESTDTVELRAVFDNSKNVLIPGQFVTVSTTDPNAPPVLVVPQAAVQLDKKGHFVFVVDSKSEVVRKDVELGDQRDGKWVVKSGLEQGQKVIVQGLQKVHPGLTVKAENQQS